MCAKQSVRIVAKTGQAKQMVHAKPTAWTIRKRRMTNNVKVSTNLATGFRAARKKQKQSSHASHVMLSYETEDVFASAELATVTKFRTMIIHTVREHLPNVIPALFVLLSKEEKSAYTKIQVIRA